ncbi:hypothetical protein Dimus_032736 [Dionaea muscipula]
MASIFMAKGTILNLPKAFCRSPSLFPRKISRVSFTSASKHPAQDRHARDEDADTEPHAGPDQGARRAPDVSEKKAREMEECYGELKERAKEKARDSGEEVREFMEDVADKAEETSRDMKEGTKQKTKRVAETAEEAKEKTKHAAGSAAEKTKDATGSAVETAESVGDMAKNSVKGVWGVAKGTGQKIKETIVGRSDDDDDEAGRLQKPDDD